MTGSQTFEVTFTVTVPEGHAVLTQHPDPTQPLASTVEDSLRPWRMINLETSEVKVRRSSDDEE